MDFQTRQNYTDRIDNELRGNILPFWIKQSVDPVNGGFYGEVGNDLTVNNDVERGSLLSSRILWTFTSAYRHFRQAEYLTMALWAYTDLEKRFWDEKNGGLYWSASADGRPLRTRKQVYGQAFGIYAMTELYRVTNDQSVLDRAIRMYRLLEQHAREKVHGGYLEAFAADWGPEEDLRLSAIDLNEPKSQNTHLHVMEAYTNLLRVWPDDGLRRAQIELIGIMTKRILNPNTSHLGLFFDLAWNLKSDRISFGHDIEAAWLLHEAAVVVGDPGLTEEVRRIAVSIAAVTHDQALDPDGSLLYEANAKGLTLTYKEWWPQAEAAVGFLDAYQICRDKKYLEASLRLWDFIENKLVDRRNGEWFRAVERDGRLSEGQAKISFWKCPYHNGRACLEMLNRLKTL